MRPSTTRRLDARMVILAKGSWPGPEADGQGDPKYIRTEDCRRPVCLEMQGPARQMRRWIFKQLVDLKLRSQVLIIKGLFQVSFGIRMSKSVAPDVLGELLYIER